MDGTPGVSSARRWSVVALLWVAFFLNYVDRQAIFSVFPSLRSDLGFTSAELGLVGSIFLWCYSIWSLAAGRIADRFSRPQLVCLCLVIWSGATLGTALSTSVRMLLFWRGVMGLSESMYLPASMALIADLHTSKLQSTALSLHQTAQMIGIIVGGWGGGWMADHFGWRSLFLVLAIAGIAYAPALWTGLRRFHAKSERVVRAKPWFGLLRSRCYLALACAFTAYCLMLWILYSWFPLHLYERFHISQGQSGLIATLTLQGSTAAGVVLWGAASDRLARTTRLARFLVLGLGIAVSAPFAWWALSANSLRKVEAVSLLFGFFAGGLHANIAAAPFEVVPRENRGMSIALLNLIGGMGGGAAILLTGLYRQKLGISYLMRLCSITAIIGAALMLLIVRKYLPLEFRRDNESQTETLPVSEF
ncbi:MAG: MFS transporter [Acidobacteriaceae bacterium]|nr:MFS transporter [Acidobacteriaceae bacterium]